MLERINGPADLRGLTYRELDVLAGEIREFIVQAVSVSTAGGHLGSNLGAVELTLAVHRVFDSPRDVVLWDTGHQAYVHKILTGRREGFTTLRQAGGLSGYPQPPESEHDWVENSHASTILSYAHGLATAVELNEQGRHVVAIIGDGSMTGGMAYEGLNNLGHSGKQVVIILNDNNRSYAPTVSRLSQSLTRLRLHPGLKSLRSKVEETLRELPAVGGLAYSSVQGLYSAIREVLEPTAFFETLGVRYVGPIDGHDIGGIEHALRQARGYGGPMVVHVLTQKGRGYPPAEDDDEKHLHDVPASGFDKATGPVPVPSVAKSYTQAFSETLIELAAEDPRIVAITAAMPGPTGLLPFQARFPDRTFDVGIAEQHAVTSAAGMAMGGLRPVVAVYSTFLSRAFDQTNLDVGLHGQPVVLCLDRAGITGPNGASHHGVLDMVLLSKVPGMTIFAPSSYQELQGMLHDALDLCDGPAAIRWPGGEAPIVGEHEVGHGLGARKVREGDDVCLVGVGKLLEACVGAADLLAGEGIEATVWDPRVVKPLDPELIDDAARFVAVVTAEDGLRVGGAGTALADALAERATVGAPNPVVRTLG